jgi:hypothetical protein
VSTSISKPTKAINPTIDLTQSEEKIVREFVKRGQALDKPISELITLGIKVKAIFASKTWGIPVLFEGRSYMNFDSFVEANLPICGRTMRRWLAKEGKTDKRFAHKPQPKLLPENASASKAEAKGKTAEIILPTEARIRPAVGFPHGKPLPENLVRAYEAGYRQGYGDALADAAKREARRTRGTKLIVSLCDHSGNWPSAYASDPDYEVLKIDLLDGRDVRLLPCIGRPVHGILAAPPCTHFSAAAGVRSWGRKGVDAVIEGMQVVDACLRLVAIYRPVWWALENPVGRLKYWIGPSKWTFNPCDYGGYLEPGEKTLKCSLFPANDAYTKRTCVWGTARKPVPKPVAVTLAPRPEGGWRNECFTRHEEHRSITPLGFSRAFKEANP